MKKPYRLGIEISPFSPLSPRHYIRESQFNKIRNKKIKAHDGKCECCDRSDIRIELHEGFTIKNNTYTFDGFYLLCTLCHDLVHCVTIDSTLDSKSEKDFLHYWRWKKEIHKYSKYKSVEDFAKGAIKVLDNTFNFIMSKNISTDYSEIKKYGVSLTEFKDSFKKKFSHTGRIKLILTSLRHIRMTIRQYENTTSGLSKYQLALYDEYLKYQKLYTENEDRILGIHRSNKERQKLISDLADAINDSDTPEEAQDIFSEIRRQRVSREEAKAERIPDTLTQPIKYK